MAADAEFTAFVLDQLAGLGAFESKKQFGGTALMKDGAAFAKVKHGALWFKVDPGNVDDFIARGMPQYTYGKDNSRSLNFYRAPDEVLDDPDLLLQWATRACDAAARTRK